MATNRTTLRWLRGAAASALAALTLIVLAEAPAQADGEVGFAFNPAGVQVQIGGGNQRVDVSLTNQSVGQLDVAISGAANGLNNLVGVEMGGGSGCNGGGGGVQCRLEPGGSATFQLNVAPKAESNLPEGQPLTGSYDITAASRDTASQAQGRSSTSLPITVTGGANTSSVPSVSGTIQDDEGKPFAGVKVEIEDPEGAKFSSTTNDSGQYSITPTNGGKIAPGEIKLKASKSGWQTKSVSINAEGGKPATSNFSMIKKTEKPADSGSAEAPAAEAPADEEKDDGWGAGTWILAIVGVLFVVGGIVAIVLLLKRGKHDEEDDDLFSDKPPVHTPKAAQTGLPGLYDAGPRSPVMDAPTMIHNGPLLDLDDDDLARYGSGASTPGFGPAYGDRGEQPTQMFDPRDVGPVSGGPRSAGPVSGGPGGAAGAPTQMFDPRGGGYDDRDAYGSPPAPRSGGYDDRGGYGQPADRGGYGSPPAPERGGYGSPPAPERGGYGTPPAPERGGYDDRGYGPPAPPPPPPPMPPATPSRGGYDDRGGYGQPADRGGYDDRGGYGTPPAPERGGYSTPPAPERGGYDDRGPYSPPAPERGGYDSPSPYGPPPQQQSYEADPRYDRPQPGYGPPAQDQRGGYDERDPYGPPATPPPPPPSERDGYDDRGYDDRPRW
ncbi:carboxypeptidase regulatory-like domain-containing protein [Phytomonospora sp. NPDC050363]|uniref:carboxypeptidase regulatory-like domain-containing protein n=1 Tax=Phytomonospora sp. NPDC050363 TaxID=3155642 RepID=UPI0033CA0A21